MYLYVYVSYVAENGRDNFGVYVVVKLVLNLVNLDVRIRIILLFSHIYERI